MKKHEPLTENEKMLIKEGLKKEIPSFVRQLLISIGICVFFYVFLTYLSPITIERVSGQSMNPTLQDGALILVDKRKSTINNLKEGDIVVTKKNVFSQSRGETISLIKRVILTPNSQYDKIYISTAEEEPDGISHLYLYNGNSYTQKNKIQEYYIKEPMNNTESFSANKTDGYVLLGDNRNNSLDSRHYGCFKKEDMHGKVILQLLPFAKL